LPSGYAVKAKGNWNYLQRALRTHHQTLHRGGVPAHLEPTDLRTCGASCCRSYAEHARAIRLPAGSLLVPMMREPADADMKSTART